MREVTGKLVLRDSNIDCEVPEEIVVQGRSAVERYILMQAAIHGHIELYDMEIWTPVEKT